MKKVILFILLLIINTQYFKGNRSFLGVSYSNPYTINSDRSATVLNTLVSPGETVTNGDTLITLYSPQLELDIEKQQKILWLPLDKVQLAIKRDYSLPIKFNGTEIEKNEFIKNMKYSGLTIQTGGRIMNVCDNVNKSKAMSKALQLIRKQLDDEIITIGVGDNENDIEMIKQTDYPCLVKNENFDSSLINIDNLIKSDEPSPKGWSDVIKTALQKI